MYLKYTGAIFFYKKRKIDRLLNSFNRSIASTNERPKHVQTCPPRAVLSKKMFCVLASEKGKRLTLNKIQQEGDPEKVEHFLNLG